MLETATSFFCFFFVLQKAVGAIGSFLHSQDTGTTQTLLLRDYTVTVVLVLQQRKETMMRTTNCHSKSSFPLVHVVGEREREKNLVSQTVDLVT